MLNTELVVDGEVNLESYIDGEIENVIQIGKEEPPDLYNLWTDIVGLYLGRDQASGYANLTPNKTIDSSGEVVDGGAYVCEVFLPVDPHYHYIKDDHRIDKLTYYDKDKNFIEQDTTNRYTGQTYGTSIIIIKEARFIRFCTNTRPDNWSIQIIRIA